MIFSVKLDPGAATIETIWTPMSHLQAPQMAHHSGRNVSRSLAPGPLYRVVTRNLSTGKKLWKVDVFYWLETCLFRSKKKSDHHFSRQPMCFESFLLSYYPCLLATRLSNHRHRLLPNPPVSSHEFPVETTASHSISPNIQHRWPTGRVFAWFNRPSALLYISYIEHENHLHSRLHTKASVHKVFRLHLLQFAFTLVFFAHP